MSIADEIMDSPEEAEIVRQRMITAMKIDDAMKANHVTKWHLGDVIQKSPRYVNSMLAGAFTIEPKILELIYAYLDIE